MPVRQTTDFQFAGGGTVDDFTTPGWEGDPVHGCAQVVQQRPRELLSDHKRIRKEPWVAILETPLAVSEKLGDSVLEHLMQSCREALPGWNRRVRMVSAGT